MEDKIFCPRCHKRNDIQKFCIYCGHKMLDDEQIKLMTDNPEPYCLNCGRHVGKGQANCECGYEFRIIDCPKCNSKNSYTNRFCTTCGKKLWTSDVCGIHYGKIKFPLIGDRFPHELRNTIMHSRYKRKSINFPGDIHKIGTDVKQLQSNKSIMDNHLNEIISRWKIVSPNYCINCLSIIKPEEYLCKDCGDVIDEKKLVDCFKNKKPLPVFDKVELKDEKRVDYLKNKKYVRPVFDIVELKWNSKFTEYYLDSLSPTIGESQFEYRERLKWEFVENKSLKSTIQYQIACKIKEEERNIAYERQKAERKRQEEERRKWEEEYIRQYGGGYCSSSCIYYYEEIITQDGISADYTEDLCGVDHCCSLGHCVSEGSFCKDYE